MQNADQLYLSALSVIEIKAGSEKLRGAGGERRAIDLDCWLERILTVAKIAGVLTEGRGLMAATLAYRTC
ncbi:MAG: hypothetical protein K2Z25_18015 [Beijerinckiaceae bacterium]|nr:hypothetical protein [Beijerinckiaceae bacterium]